MNKPDSGQTLVEVIIATAMVSLVLVAIVSGVVLGVRNSRFSKNQSLATRYSQEGIEALRSYRESVGWQPFYTKIGTGGTYCFNQLPANFADFNNLSYSNCNNTYISGTVNVNFEREIAVWRAAGPPQAVNFTITVRWQEGSQSHESKIEGILNERD